MHLHWNIILGKNIFKHKRCFPTIKKFACCLVSIDTWGNSLLPPIEEGESLHRFFLFFFLTLVFHTFFLHPHLWKQKVTKLKPGNEICLRKTAWFISSRDFIFAHLLIISWLLQIVLLPAGKKWRIFNWSNDFPSPSNTETYSKGKCSCSVAEQLNFGRVQSRGWQTEASTPNLALCLLL